MYLKLKNILVNLTVEDLIKFEARYKLNIDGKQWHKVLNLIFRVKNLKRRQYTFKFLFLAIQTSPVFWIRLV